MLHLTFAEDDSATAEQIQTYLRRYQAEHGVELQVRHFAAGNALMEHYHEQPCQLLLLDIELPGMDGMEIARRIRAQDREVVIVFITNMAQYAIQGYEVNAMDFVLKPIQYFSFSTRLERALQRVQQRTGKTLCLQLPDGMQLVDTRDIYYLETQNRMLHYHTAQGVFSVRGSLAAAEKELKPFHFERCNQCYLVNLRHVTGVQKDAVLVAGHALEISRRSKAGFLAAVAAFVGGFT